MGWLEGVRGLGLHPPTVVVPYSLVGWGQSRSPLRQQLWGWLSGSQISWQWLLQEQGELRWCCQSLKGGMIIISVGASQDGWVLMSIRITE